MMNTTQLIDNPRAYQKSWYLKLNDLQSQRAIWIRFTLLSTGNGFKRVAETWAVFFQRDVQNREVKKLALKQTYDMGAFQQTESGIQIGNSELTPTYTRGSIQSKGNSIEWDFHIISGRKSSCSFVPEVLSKTGLVKNVVQTLDEELLFTGTTKMNGQETHWKEAPGMHGQLEGPKSGYSWVWGHCNSFQNESGKPVDFIFEGLSARTKVGPLISPKLSSFFFYYKDRPYFFNTLKDAISLKSRNTLNEWEFQADRDDLSFRGYAKAEHKDFAGLTYEDTNGSLLYCANSKLSDMKILVYRGGKLESTLTSLGSAAFEVVSREKNPYVPLLI